MATPLYKCACLNCNYRTALDLTIGTAEAAARLHILSPGIHTVKVINQWGTQVQQYSNAG